MSDDFESLPVTIDCWTKTDEMLARLILKMKEWSYDILDDGDYSKEFSELVEWARIVMGEE